MQIEALEMNFPHLSYCSKTKPSAFKIQINDASYSVD